MSAEGRRRTTWRDINRKSVGFSASLAVGVRHDDGHAPAEAASMADEMFARYEARVAEDPGNHAMDYGHSYFHASKA